MVARILRGTGLALVLATVLVVPFPRGPLYPVWYRTSVAVVALGFVLWGLGGWLGGRRLSPAVTGVDAADLALVTA